MNLKLLTYLTLPLFFTGFFFVEPTNAGDSLVPPKGLVLQTLHSININHAACSVSVCIAVGRKGVMYRKPATGGEWLSVNSGTYSTLHHIAVSSNRWVAVGKDGSIIQSNDGIIWEAKRLSGRPRLKSVAVRADGEHWVAVGDDGVIVSADETNILRTQILSVPVNINSIAVSPTDNHWVAVGRKGKIASSNDGLVWNIQTIDEEVYYRSIAVSPQNNRWMVLGHSGKLLSSDDGKQWKHEDFSYPDAENIVVSPRGLWVLTGSQNWGRRKVSKELAISNDGISWQIIKKEDLVSFTANDYLMLINGNGDHLLETTLETQAQLYDITYSKKYDVWFAIGPSGKLMRSTNGITWKPQTTPTKKTLHSIALSADNHHWVVVGDDGVILYSIDGINWTLQNSGASATLYDVAFSEKSGLWVAVGNRGTILSSSNAKEWYAGKINISNSNEMRILTVAASPLQKQWVAMGHCARFYITPPIDFPSMPPNYGFAYYQKIDEANRKYHVKDSPKYYSPNIAKDIYGRNLTLEHSCNRSIIFTSHNGIEWKAKPLDVNTVFHKLAVSPKGNQWVAVGYDHGVFDERAPSDGQRIITSKNGLNWQVPPTGHGRNLYDVAVSPKGDYWVAVGDRGTVLVSDDAAHWSPPLAEVPDSSDEHFGALYGVAISPNNNEWLAVGTGLIVGQKSEFTFPAFTEAPSLIGSPTKHMVITLDQGDSHCEKLGVQLLGQSLFSYHNNKQPLITIASPVEQGKRTTKAARSTHISR